MSVKVTNKVTKKVAKKVAKKATKKATKVVFRREGKVVLVSMYCKEKYVLRRFILRKRGHLFFGGKKINGNLYDLIKEAVESSFQKDNYPFELKLVSFKKPKGDLLDIVKNVYCKGEEFSFPVEYEVRLHKEDLFDCKDC